MPYSSSYHYGPDYWGPQCYFDYYEPYNPFTRKYGGCLTGDALSKVEGWDLGSTLAKVCEECSSNRECYGWRMDADNKSATLLTGRVKQTFKEQCIAGQRNTQHHGGGSWGPAASEGGYWYSTPVSAECPEGAELGSDGCAWRVVDSAYRNASCVDGLVDIAVEQYGKVCFDECPRIKNWKVEDCYLDCYKNSLLGDAAYNLTAMPKEAILEPWEKGFSGACGVVTPASCEGDQCGPP
jgi:hypothetical protein